MKEMYLYVRKNSGVLTFLALIVIVFSSCSQKIAGHYKTNKMEIEQSLALSYPENSNTIIAEEAKEVKTQVALIENIADKKQEAAANNTTVTKKHTKKMLIAKLKEVNQNKTEIIKKTASINALPLLAMNKSIKGAKKTAARDMLTLGIVFLIVGIVVVAISPNGIISLIGSIIAILGLVFLILYILDVM